MHGCDQGGTTSEQVDMEVYPSSPRKYAPGPAPLELDPQGFLTLPHPGTVPEGSARVCVITSVVVDTPSVVVCSVDVEPCSVINQSIVHTSVQEVPSSNAGKESQALLESSLETPPETPKEDDDVMDRICHDLDYLLGGLPRETKAEIPHPDESQCQDSLVAASTAVHQTSL